MIYLKKTHQTIEDWRIITDSFYGGFNEIEMSADFKHLLREIKPYLEIFITANKDVANVYSYSMVDIIRSIRFPIYDKVSPTINKKSFYENVGELLIKIIKINRDFLNYIDEKRFKLMLSPFVIEYLQNATCYSLDKLDSITSSSAIYSIWANKNCTENGYSQSFEYPLYVGRTNNLKARMKNHHRIPELEFLQHCGVDLNFYFVEETPFRPFGNNLNILESKLIECLNPVLNNQLMMQVENFETINNTLVENFI